MYMQSFQVTGLSKHKTYCCKFSSNYLQESGAHIATEPAAYYGGFLSAASLWRRRRGNLLEDQETG